MNHEVMALLLGDGDEVTGCIFPFLFPFTNEIVNLQQFCAIFSYLLKSCKEK